MAERNRSHDHKGSHHKESHKEHTMTREEAGHLGGAAPHSCRGRECESKHKHRADKR